MTVEFIESPVVFYYITVIPVIFGKILNKNVLSSIFFYTKEGKMMSFVKNFTEYSVGTESFEFSVIPIEFNHNSRGIFGNPIGLPGNVEITKPENTGIFKSGNFH